MSFGIVTPELNHVLVPASEANCPYCGLHLRGAPLAPQHGGASASRASPVSAPMPSSAQQLLSPVDFVVIDLVLDTTNNPVPPATTTTYAQK